jgi:hypothetical protein
MRERSRIHGLSWSTVVGAEIITDGKYGDENRYRRNVRGLAQPNLRTTLQGAPLKLRLGGDVQLSQKP